MRARASRSRKILLGMAISVMMLGILEISLRLFSAISGYDLTVDPLPRTDLSQVLSDRDDRLEFIPQRHGDGLESDREVVFSRKPTRPRVVVIGESFVFCTRLSAPEAWPARLEAQLGGEVEVLNFGRVGAYASMLVPVVEASLAIDADVIILAMGNNEHTMTTFYTGWAGRHPNLIYSVSEALGNIRIYGLLYHLLLGGPRVAELPDADGGRERDDPIDQEIYSIRRRPPQVGEVPDRLAAPESTAALEAEQRLKERVFRGTLQAMVEDGLAAGATVVLATLPVDLLAPPVVSGLHAEEIDASEEARHRAVMTMLGAGLDFSSVQEFAREQELTEVDLQRNAHYQFAKGEALLAQGERDEAIVALRRAVEWDMVPDNTPSLNEIVRAVAREYDCPLIDLNKRAEAFIDNPEAFFLDSIHVNAEGAEVVAEWVAEALREEVGLVGGGRRATGR